MITSMQNDKILKVKKIFNISSGFQCRHHVISGVMVPEYALKTQNHPYLMET